MDEQAKAKKKRGTRGQGWLYARKDSPCLWCGYHLRGREIRESTGETSEQKARQYLRRRLDEIGADRVGAKVFAGPAGDRLRMGELLADLETNYRARDKWTPSQAWRKKRAAEFFGQMRVRDVNISTFDAFMVTAKTRSGRDMNPGTENSILQWASQAIDLGRKNRKHAFPSIEWERNSIAEFAREIWLEDSEVRVITNCLNSIGEDARADFTLACYIAYWRPESVAKLTVSSVKTDRNGLAASISFPASTDKLEKACTIELAGEIQQVITRRLVAAGSDPDAPLFGREYLGCMYPISQFAKWWKAARIACGLPTVINGQRVVFYVLRHSGASAALAADVPIPVVQHCGGWLSPHVLLKIYAKVKAKQYASAFLKVEDHKRKEAEAEQAQVEAEAVEQRQQRERVQ